MNEKSQPQIDFVTFVLSLASSVQVHLGRVPNPETKATAKNLELARQTIDILTMLGEKTKGNLTPEESQLMEHLLYDLRMQYVEVSQ